MSLVWIIGRPERWRADMGGRGTFAAGNNAAYQEFLILNIEYNYNAKDMHSREYPAMLI